MKSGIYEIACDTTGRRYVGSSINIAKRWAQHVTHLRQGRHHSRHMQRAWDKYGAEGFRFKKLLICSKENLLMYEQILLDAMKPEFNSYFTAGSALGSVTRPETKEKLRIAMTGRYVSEETRARMRAARKLVGPLPPMSAETKAKLSAAHKGKPKFRSEQHKINLGLARRLFSNEQVESIRAEVLAGKSRTQCAIERGCSIALISNIVSGKSYQWVPL